MFTLTFPFIWKCNQLVNWIGSLCCHRDMCVCNVHIYMNQSKFESEWIGERVYSQCHFNFNFQCQMLAVKKSMVLMELNQFKLLATISLHSSLFNFNQLQLKSKCIQRAIILSALNSFETKSLYKKSVPLKITSIIPVYVNMRRCQS